jgi:hypothetical protein
MYSIYFMIGSLTMFYFLNKRGTNKTGNININVTLRSVLATTVAGEKQ